MREGWVKAALFTGVRFSGLLATSEALARGVPILAYHGVCGEARAPHALANRRRLHVPRDLFARQLDWLGARFRLLPLSELAAALRAGREPPARAAVLTFDDGYRNVLTQALPLLHARGLPAACFVLTGDDPRPLWQDRLEAALEATSRPRLCRDGVELPLATPDDRERACAHWMRALDAQPAHAREAHLAELIEALGGPGDLGSDERRRLTWDEVRALHAAGFEIGSHAERHEPLTADDPHAAAAELRASRERLEGELGAPAGGFALSYPYGARDRAVVAAARAAGFTCALTGVPRRSRAGDEAFELGRFLVGADDDLPRLRASLSGLRGLWQGDPWPVRR
jgi:peptidoglycan/xylan/chitin deacetylase (PgdA/CDA1 family)